MPRGLKPTDPSKENKVRVSSGRGGSGNIVSADEIAAADLNHEAELFHRRRMERKQEEVVKYTKKQYTGRGGTGNINYATVAQWVSFDRSSDPDDSYEDIIVERNKQAPKPLRTGRGGSGNGLLKPAANQSGVLVPDSSRLSFSSSNTGSSSNASSSRLSDVSFASSSNFSLTDRRRSESSAFSRFAKFKQRERSSTNPSVPPAGSQSRWRISRRTDTPIPTSVNNQLTPQIVVNDCDFLECLDETSSVASVTILEVMERFEDDVGDETVLETPELQPSSSRNSHNLSEDTPDEEEPDDELDSDNQDAEWERDVIAQAQDEIAFHALW